MAKLGKFSMGEMEKLQKQLSKIQKEQAQRFLEACAKELAARLLRKVINRTQTGQYDDKEVSFTTRTGKQVKFTPHTGKKGGTLRRGWTSKTQEEAENGKKASAKEYVDSLTINHIGDMIQIEIINPVEYASYVEYGHRTANHRGWVRGQFMMTISEREIQDIAPKVLEQKIKHFFEECIK